MKLFFISDIHGSNFYLTRALERYRAEKADALILLGDELYHGARNPLPQGYDPQEVAAALNAYSDRIIAVRGNCDSEVDGMVLTFPMMSSYSVVFYNGRRLFLTHGHLYHDGKMPCLAAGDVFLYGHTHVPRAEKLDGIYRINPGSISMPKENTPHCCGVLEGDRFQIKDLDGNLYKEIVLN